MKKTITLALNLILITSPTLLLLSHGVQYFIQLVMSTSFLKRCQILLALLTCMATGLPGKIYYCRY